ncbi:MAG: contractile injection system protein, VgrG/Pvc8 family [Candidatus Pristimantibacillus sp.]
MKAFAVSYDVLTIHPFDMKLYDVLLVKKINEHARLTFTGIIPEEKEEYYVQMAEEQTAIKLQYVDDHGKSRILFQGILLQLHIKVEKSVYWLEAEVVSYTHSMDIKLENRAFQNHSLTTADVMEQIGGTYVKAPTFNTVTKDQPLGAFTLQYQETDWEFLKRMASRIHSVLIPVSTHDSICLYLGIPDDRDAGELETTHYRVYKDLLAYKDAGGMDYADLTEQDFICYEVTLNRVLELGDQVKFKGQKLHVFEVKTEMKRGVLLHTYTLCSKKAGYRRQTYNPKLIGASIQGKVMAVVRDDVKVQLEYDHNWSLDTASLFPYSTMYASEDQTGWYCMPEKGDDVRVYFPSAKEGEGIALSTVRKKLPQEAMQSSNQTTTIVQQEQLQPVIHYDQDVKDDLMANPNTKFLLTPTGQKITFEEDRITITGATGGATITLTSAGTIILNCENKIMLQSSKQIEMVSESIMMVANQIEMSTKDKKGGLTIDQGQVVIKGIEILMNQ